MPEYELTWIYNTTADSPEEAQENARDWLSGDPEPVAVAQISADPDDD